MRIQLNRDVLVDVYNPRLDETFDRQLQKWEVINVETIEEMGKTADLAVYGELIYMGVPLDSFKVI